MRKSLLSLLLWKTLLLFIFSLFSACVRPLARIAIRCTMSNCNLYIQQSWIVCSSTVSRTQHLKVIPFCGVQLIYLFILLSGVEYIFQCYQDISLFTVNSFLYCMSFILKGIQRFHKEWQATAKKEVIKKVMVWKISLNFQKTELRHKGVHYL